MQTKVQQHLFAHFDPRRAWIPFLVIAGVVLWITFIFLNPVSGAALDPLARAVFWAMHVFPALALLQAAQTLLGWVPGYGRGSVWPWVALAGVLGALLFTPFAFWIDMLFGLDVDGSFETDEEETLVAEFFALAPIFIVVWTTLNAGRLLRLQPDAEMPDAEPSAPVTEAFWQRVPVSIGRDLIALSAELHYLRVRTAQGDALVLYAFGTAVSELSASAAPGQQTHRSHWVMRHHIQKIERVGQRAICHMTDGTQIPVSRAYRAAIEAAVSGDQSTGA